jgi:hypothetical protein
MSAISAMLSPSVILSDSEEATRTEEESKDPDDAYRAMPPQGVLTRIDFAALPTKECAANSRTALAVLKTFACQKNFHVETQHCCVSLADSP